MHLCCFSLDERTSLLGSQHSSFSYQVTHSLSGRYNASLEAFCLLRNHSLTYLFGTVYQELVGRIHQSRLSRRLLRPFL